MGDYVRNTQDITGGATQRQLYELDWDFSKSKTLKENYRVTAPSKNEERLRRLACRRRRGAVHVALSPSAAAARVHLDSV